MDSHELHRAVALVVPRRRAQALIARARRVAGVGRRHDLEDLEVSELLMVLEALAAEGGVLQEVAVELAQRALAEDAGRADGAGGAGGVAATRAGPPRPRR